VLYSIAALKSEELEAIQNLERRLGKRVLALKQLSIEFDDLSENDLAEIQLLEVELGLAIIAVK